MRTQGVSNVWKSVVLVVAIVLVTSTGAVRHAAGRGQDDQEHQQGEHRFDGPAIHSFADVDRFARIFESEERDGQHPPVRGPSPPRQEAGAGACRQADGRSVGVDARRISHEARGRRHDARNIGVDRCRGVVVQVDPHGLTIGDNPPS